MLPVNPPSGQHPTAAADWTADYARLEQTIFQPDRLRRLYAVIVGAGALGNEVVKALGLLGIGRMLIVDPDSVEPSNLTRSILFRTPQAAASNKAAALAQAASRLFSDTSVEAAEREIADVGFQKIAGADILFSCVDSDLARLEIAYIGAKLDRPVCDAGLGTRNYSHGRVSFFPGRSAGCYCCGLGEHKRRELLTAWDSPAHPCWSQPGASGDPASGTVPPIPSTPTMAAVIGSMQVEIGLRQLFEAAAEASAVELTLAPRLKLETFALRPSEACPFHISESRMVAAPEHSPELSVGDLLDSAGSVAEGEPVLLLDWPICVRARCADCGEGWQPMRRLGWLRRRGTCPNCGSRRFTEEETITQVSRDSAWARFTPRALGLPDRHLHTIRFEGVAEDKPAGSAGPDAFGLESGQLESIGR